MLRGLLNIFKKFSKSLLLFLISGFLINMAFASIDSSSFFTKETSAKLQVKAANIQDILEKFEIKMDNESNAMSIIIKRAADLTFNPIIYFSVEGELSNYILHINPILLEENKEYEIKINVNGDTGQLSENVSDIFKGKVTAKYLNEFISESLDIQMSKEYVLNNRPGFVEQGMDLSRSATNKSLNNSTDVQLENNQSMSCQDAESFVIPKESLQIESSAAETLKPEREIKFKEDAPINPDNGDAKNELPMVKTKDGT